MADINREAQEFAEIMADVNREMKLYGQLHANTAERLKDAEMKAKFGIDNFSKATGMGADALSKFGEAAFSSGKVLLDGKKGAAALNGTMDQLTDSVKMAAVALSLMVPGGPLIKGLVAGIALLTVSVLDAGKKYTQAANEMSDKLYKGYQDLAQSGAAASDGMTGLFNDAKKLGLSMNEIGQYTELIAANSKDLALFSGSVFEGRQKFADMGKSMEQYREGLMNAGMTQEQINSGMMGYLKLQSRVGQSQNKTTSELADGAKKYLIEMDGLSKITGETRKGMEDQMEAARSEERFAAKLQELRSQGRFDEAKELEKTNLILASQSKEAAQGFRDLSTGMITTEAAQKTNLLTQGEAMKQADRLSNGLAKAGDAATAIGTAAGKTANALTPLAKAGAAGDVIGDYSGALRLGVAAQNNFGKQLTESEKELERQGGKGGKAADAAVQAQTDLVRMQQKGNEAVERFVFAGVVPATNAMTILVEQTTLAAGAMAKMFGLAGQEQGGTAELGVGGEQGGSGPDVAAVAASGGLAGQLDAENKIKKLPEYEKTLAEIEKYQKLFNDGNKLNEKQLEGFRARSEIAAQAVADYNKKFAAPTAPAGGGGAAAGGGAAPATRSATPSGGGGTQVQSSNQQLAQSGLKVKQGDVQKEGATIDTRVLDMAKQVQANLPGFAYFSGFNDVFHNEKSPKSLHTKGLAMDFALQKAPTVQEGQDVVKYLKSLGATVAIDEYNNPSSKSTAGHIHASIPELADGGVATGPTSGYPATLHGTEAVIPLKNGAVPVSLDLKQALSGPTFAGSSEYGGYNMGPMSTDIEAVKKLAEAVGAFDKTSQIITDPATWKQILSSGLATNYKLVNAELGTKALPGLDQDMADRLKEIKEQGNTTTEAALKQVAEELITGMNSMAEKFALTMTSRALSMDPSELAPLMQELISATKNGVDVQQKILASNY